MKSNNSKPDARQAVVEFVKELARKDGFPMVQASRFNSDIVLGDDSSSLEPIRLLPTYLSLHGLHRCFVESQQTSDSNYNVSWTTFRNSFKSPELEHVRLSIRMRGLCDLCMQLRDSLRTVSDDRVAEVMETINAHVNDSRMMRDEYRNSKEAAKKGDIVCVSFDFAQ
tara:strand:- start:270 stop:773 length:504 start_codon:yes stop_codon:yes gene_type:complete